MALRIRSACDFPKSIKSEAIFKVLKTNGFQIHLSHDIDFNPRRYHAYTRPQHHVTDLVIAEDNEAVIKIIKKCRSIALRHLPRTHRIDVNWLFEVCNNPEICVRYVNTKLQVADLMTKALNSPPIWEFLLDLAQIRSGALPPTSGGAANTTTTTTNATQQQLAPQLKTLLGPLETKVPALLLNTKTLP